MIVSMMAGAACRAWRRLAVPLLLLLLALAPAIGEAQVGQTAEVFGVRFGHDEPITRIVIDLDAPAPFTARAAVDPPRLVVELESVRWRVREHPQSRPRGLVRGLTYGHLEAGRSRLVVDASAPFKIIRQERLPPSGDIRHYRILIDIEALPRPPDGVGIALIPRPRPGTPPALSPVLSPVLSKDALAAIDEVIGPDAADGMVPDAADGAVNGGPVVAAVPLPAIRPPGDVPARPVIAIDPGHGGADPGTIGINGVHEKQVTLAVARRLRDLLQASDRYDVVMTRDADVFVSLGERMETGRRAGASLFISIHADSLGDAGFRGASVYTLSDQASDSEAARLAAKENRADIIANTDLSVHDEIVAGILIDLAQRVTNNRSIEFADLLTDELGQITRLVRNTRRYAGFVVLKSPDVPSVLLELGYLSNPTDAANLTDPAYQEKLAQAALRAIDRHFTALETAL